MGSVSLVDICFLNQMIMGMAKFGSKVELQLLQFRDRLETFLGVLLAIS